MAFGLVPQIDRLLLQKPYIASTYETYGQPRQKLLCYELALFITRLNNGQANEPSTYITAGENKTIRVPSPEDHLKGVLKCAGLSPVWAAAETISWIRERLTIPEN